jgi:hypothetical protein
MKQSIDAVFDKGSFRPEVLVITAEMIVQAAVINSDLYKHSKSIGDADMLIAAKNQAIFTNFSTSDCIQINIVVAFQVCCNPSTHAPTVQMLSNPYLRVLIARPVARCLRARGRPLSSDPAHH